MKTIKKAGLVGALVFALGVGYTAFAQQKEEAPLEEQAVPQEEANEETVPQEISDYVESVVQQDVQGLSRAVTQIGDPYQAVKNEEYDKALQILGGYLTKTKDYLANYKETLAEAPLTAEARTRANALIDEQVTRIDDLLSEQK